VRTVGVVTAGRSDWNGLLSVLRELRRRDEVGARLYVTGTHLSRAFGRTVEEIRASGFEPDAELDVLVDADTPEAIARSIARGVEAFAGVLAAAPPDLLLMLGDRFESHAAALAALPFNVPVAHISGGEVTHGAFDDSLRHSMTKLSHLHFVANEVFAARVLQLGEEPWRVHVTGDPAIDHIAGTALLSRAETAARFGLDAAGQNLLVTYHPVTLEYRETATRIAALLDAIASCPARPILTYPNADTAGRTIIEAVEAFPRRRPDARVVVNAGPVGYLSLLAHVDAMVGNSSSGLWEAPSFGLPVVNVGRRQGGRLQAANVIDCGDGAEEIAAALRVALAPDTRRRLAGMVNPYGDGKAAPRIVDALASAPLGPELTVKRFVDR
jgi:UDP-N-acetylglucosamine 2-epimerase (non-hydrolysing)/GDP/UDP-N,N'-diacetylbacillosamine 2-epimerase (hydrolysing)